MGCPFCRVVGTLNLHGYLRGYREDSSEEEVRGRRVYCSKRGRRGGCGHTFSVLLAGVIRGFRISAESLWRFLCNVAGGMSPQEALSTVLPTWTEAAGASLWRRFSAAQVHIRDLLLRVIAPPPCDSTVPALHTIAHLRTAFPAASCPISAFQIHFQTSLLPPITPRP